MTTDNILIDGIINKAEERADKMIKEAEAKAEQIIIDAKLKTGKDRAAEEKNRENLLSQVEIRRNGLMQGIVRKHQLSALNSMFDSMRSSVVDKLLELLGSEKGREVLINWTVEAAIGVNLPTAKIWYNPKYPLTKDDLLEAEKRIRNLIGRDMDLVLCEEHIPQVGVVAGALDDSISFANIVDVRLRRFESAIKVKVQELACKRE